MKMKTGNKVSEIEFHITGEEVEDFILRAAKLIKEGYKLYSFKNDTPTFSWLDEKVGPFIHVVFKRSYYE